MWADVGIGPYDRVCKNPVGAGGRKGRPYPVIARQCAHWRGTPYFPRLKIAALILRAVGDAGPYTKS